ncbi:MAG: alpha/beta hydrolase [Ilumatobacteraceae bacterium]
MSATTTASQFTRLPTQMANVPLTTARGAAIVPVNLTAADGVPSKGLLYTPATGVSRVGVHLMHPRTDQSQNYNIAPLVEAGYTVLGRGGRSVNNDVDTVHEELMLDVAAGVELLKQHGCEQVVLLGNSGGGALAAMYQAQAETKPGSRFRPALPYTSVDLDTAHLPPADGIVLIGAHMGEGEVLLRLIDASVIDEGDPESVDRRLDPYSPANGFRIPLELTHYSAEFLAEYRAAQRQRVARLDAIALDAIERAVNAERLLGSTDESFERRYELERQTVVGKMMVIYRTLADPAFVDTSIDPDDRIPGGKQTHGRPDLQNYSHEGFARYLTPRAWLSTWSALSTPAQTLPCLCHVTVPVFVAHYAGDPYTRLGQLEELRVALAGRDAAFEVIRKVDHYGFAIDDSGQVGARSPAGVNAVANWLRDRFPLD